MATNPPITQQASRDRDDAVVTGLVTRARNGERQAWDALVERYAPLIWSICRRYRLEAADAEDAAQTVWLKLGNQLDKVRDLAALPGWLATTTRRECSRILRATPRPGDAGYALAAGTIPDDHAQPAEQDLLAAERHTVLREASEELPRLPAAARPAHPRPRAVVCRDQRARLGMPAGSIGPSRRRCLDKLRRHPAVTALINADTAGPSISVVTGMRGFCDQPSLGILADLPCTNTGQRVGVGDCHVGAGTAP